jgi:alanine racemase
MTGETSTYKFIKFIKLKVIKRIQMQDILRKIFRPRINYQPLIEIRISKAAILHNLETFKKTYPKFQFAPVLKSNAYGHGLVEVAEILDNQNLPFFMVDSFYEALILRRAFIKTKILILGFVRMQEILENKLKNVSYGIIDLEVLKKLSANASHPINIHLKLDTGMHRQGILLEEVNEAIKLIKKNQNLILEGVCSHLADADGETEDFTNKQIQIWNELVLQFKKEFPEIKYFHLSNTAGANYEQQIDANVSRLGIGLYGFETRSGVVAPFMEPSKPDKSGNYNMQLQPALEMRSIITSIKTIPAGGKVGYNITYTASGQTKVATVPVGYNEGLDRRLSNTGFVKIGNTFCPIVGRVSMNMCSVEVTGVDVKLEDEVILIGSNSLDKNSVQHIAKLSGQIPYEVLVKIPQYLKRIII